MMFPVREGRVWRHVPESMAGVPWCVLPRPGGTVRRLSKRSRVREGYAAFHYIFQAPFHGSSTTRFPPGHGTVIALSVTWHAKPFQGMGD